MRTEPISPAEDTAAGLIALVEAALHRADAGGARAAAAAAIAVATPGDERIHARRRHGDALLLGGDRLAARAEYTRALAEAVAAGNDREALLLHNGIGVTAKFTGEIELAAAHYGQALAILEARGGDEAMLAGLHHNLGGLAHTRGDLLAAERHTRTALELNARINPLGATADRGQLGSILSELGQPDEAMALLRRAASEFTAALGPDHVEVAIARTTLGAALHRAGRLAEAAAAYAEGLAAREHALGADHPELAATLLNLGQLAAARQDAAAARAYAARVVRVLEGNVVADHPFLRLARERLDAGTAGGDPETGPGRT